MKTTKGNIRCDMCFGKTPAEIIEYCRNNKSLPDVQFVGLNNPMPTGDHWKMIEIVLKYREKGEQVLEKMPPMRRDFVKKAAAALNSGGFYMEIVSQQARKFRDENDLRMQRGKVYVFISVENNENVILPS